MTFVNVFRSEGTDTSLSLQHQLAWFLITIYQVYSLTVPYLPVSPYPRELWLVLIPPLWDFCAAVLACLPMDKRMQLPYCDSLNSQFFVSSGHCQIIDTVNGFFMVVAYSAQWTGAVIRKNA